MYCMYFIRSNFSTFREPHKIGYLGQAANRMKADGTFSLLPANKGWCKIIQKWDFLHENTYEGAQIPTGKKNMDGLGKSKRGVLVAAPIQLFQKNIHSREWIAS